MSEHHHNHSHAAPTSINTAFYIGIGLNLLFVVIEATTGFITNSLALIGDAGHNLSDVFSLVLSLFAIRLLKVKNNDKYTYGYRKATIVTALVNAVVLLIAVGGIAYEAIARFGEQKPIDGKTVIIVASIGIVINFVTALLFMRNKDTDLNIKSAYLHLMADAAVSVGVVISGVIILYTGWYWVDSIISLVIVIVVAVGTWRLLSESLRLTLDGVPENVDLEKVRTVFAGIDDVKDVHHIHVWALSTTENALTAHVSVAENKSFAELEQLKHKLKHALEHQNIQHATLEFENENEGCENGIMC
ncbi:MAG: cation transporter [Porphyromonadaceae bacterium CG2_30_38_12]|nr:MAG: cation transporter [Porphyromonadaceae bacterium CG2_30_38_12]